MADFYRATKIEELNRKHPGLQKFVDEQYENKVSHTEICSMLEELYGEHVNLQTCSNYYRLVWWKCKDRELDEWLKARARFRVLKEEAAKDPSCGSAQMIELLTVDGIVRQREKIAETDPVKLMRELRQSRELATNTEIEKGKLELAVQTLRVELAKQAAPAAAPIGGPDGRELYLQASQDILKKLRTYQDLKPGLDLHQEEIIGELAHSAESFGRKLEQTA